MVTSPRIRIRESIEESLKPFVKGVFHYRTTSFSVEELPSVNILPAEDQESQTQFNVFGREQENFRVEIAMTRENDSEKFADIVDNIYEEAKRAILKIRVCNLKCSKLNITKKTWATDGSGQVPIVLVRFFVSVEFDSDLD